MTVREQLESMLIERGMSNAQATEVINIAQVEIDSLNDDGYRITYDSPATDYPQIIYSTLYATVIKKCALTWIDEYKPQAWFREMFV